MMHLFCCIKTPHYPRTDGNASEGTTPLSTISPTVLNVQPDIVKLQPKTLQPKIPRTPEKLRKSPPKRNSPVKKVKTPSPTKRALFQGVRKSRSRTKASQEEIEALYREGIEMLQLEQGLKGIDGTKRMGKRRSQMFSISTLSKPKKAMDDSSSIFGTAYDRDKSTVQSPSGSTDSKPSPQNWASALHLEVPAQEEVVRRKASSEFEAEIVIPIRRSSRSALSPNDNLAVPGSFPPNSAPVSPKSSRTAHRRMSSQGTELALDLAPDALMSQLCLDLLETSSIKPPDQPLLRPYEMPSITSSFTEDLNSPLRKVSSTIQSRVASSDYGSEPARVLRHSQSDIQRSSSWPRPPVPVPTQEKAFFRSHRDNGLVSPSEHADGTPTFVAGALRDLSRMKDLSPIREVNSPQRTPGLEHVDKKLSAWKHARGEKPAMPTSVMLRNNTDGSSSEELLLKVVREEFVDASSSRYPSQPPSRHDSTFKEWMATPTQETPPLPALDSRITNQNVSKDTANAVSKPPMARSHSIGAVSAKSGSSIKNKIVRRSLSKIKKGLAGPRANASEIIIPNHIPMFPDITPLRTAASMGSMDAHKNNKPAMTPLTTTESFKTAFEGLRRANSTGTIASVGSSMSLSPGGSLRRAFNRDRRSVSVFSEENCHSRSQSPCPRDTGGSWTRLYEDCVSNPFASYVSINRRTIDFQSMGYALENFRSSTVSPVDNQVSSKTGGDGMQVNIWPNSSQDVETHIAQAQ